VEAEAVAAAAATNGNKAAAAATAKRKKAIISARKAANEEAEVNRICTNVHILLRCSKMVCTVYIVYTVL